MGRVAATNPAIQSALLTAEAADARAKKERGTLLPQARIQGGWGIQRQDEFGKSELRHPRSEQAVVTQPISVGEEWANYKAAEAESLVALARAQLTIQDTLLRTAEVYASAIFAGERLENLQELVSILERQLNAVKHLFEAGEGTKTDIALVSARLAEAKKERALAESAKAEAMAELERQLGYEFAGMGLAWPMLEAPVLPFERVEEHHPLIQEAKARESGQKYRQLDAVADAFPELSLSASTGRDMGTATANEAWANRVTINYSIPLFTGGQTYYGIKAAKLERDASIEAVRGSAYQVRANWKAAVAAWEAAQTALDKAKEADVEQQTAIKGARLEYENGARSLTDLLDAEREYINAKSGLSQSKRNAVAAAYRLRAAQGELVSP